MIESKGHAARANRGHIMNLLLDKLGVNDDMGGEALFQQPNNIIMGREKTGLLFYSGKAMGVRIPPALPSNDGSLTFL